MRRLCRVLCAVDIDERDRDVFMRALALARSHDAKLLIVHAASPDLPFNQDATERIDFLRQLRSTAEAAGVEVLVTVQRGDAAGVILLHAGARDPDLVVVGAARDQRVRHGSIAERVLRDAPYPTLVISRNASSEQHAFANVMCAVDFSPASQAAVQEALALAQSGGRRITLVHVVNGPAPGDESLSWPVVSTHYRDIAATAFRRLQELIPRAQQGTVLARVSIGNPASELLRMTRATDEQLLMIGATPRTWLGRRLFGVTGRLLHGATCPVLAVPAAKGERLRKLAA